MGFGAFGKMPSMGDFFRLDTPPGFVRVWDAWLQSVMVSSAEVSGADWDDQYMCAPIWRFALDSGVAGEGKALGVLMPSVDRVGRRFPLALMTRVERDSAVAFDHLAEDTTFAQLEDVALAALEDDMNRDRLAACLAQIPVPNGHAPAAFQRRGRALVLSSEGADTVAPELAAGLLQSGGFERPSLWTAVLEDERRTMICEGLPDARQALALFDLNAPLWQNATEPA